MVEAEDLAVRRSARLPAETMSVAKSRAVGAMSMRLIRCTRLRAKGIASSGQNSSSASSPT